MPNCRVSVLWSDINLTRLFGARNEVRERARSIINVAPRAWRTWPHSGQDRTGPRFGKLETAAIVIALALS